MDDRPSETKDAESPSANPNRELFKRFEVCRPAAGTVCNLLLNVVARWQVQFCPAVVICALVTLATQVLRTYARQVQKLLGKGSYGIVYRVKRLSDGGVYALKEADVRKMSPLERADAVNEIRLLASVKHQNVVRYHEAFLDGVSSTAPLPTPAPAPPQNSYKYAVLPPIFGHAVKQNA